MVEEYSRCVKRPSKWVDGGKPQALVGRPIDYDNLRNRLDTRPTHLPKWCVWEKQDEKGNRWVEFGDHYPGDVPAPIPKECGLKREKVPVRARTEDGSHQAQAEAPFPGRADSPRKRDCRTSD